MTRRERIYQKYGGRCAYSGTPLEPDWQIDHVEPVQRFWDGRIAAKSRDREDNMVPCQRAINNYKWSYPLEYFRVYLLGKLHFRLRKYPYSGKGGERPMFVRKETKELGKPHEKWHNIFTEQHAKNGCVVYRRSDAAMVRHYAKKAGYHTTQKKHPDGKIIMTFKALKKITTSFGTEGVA